MVEMARLKDVRGEGISGGLRRRFPSWESKIGASGEVLF